ncbi:Kinetochore NDC80 [Micractinium conductrix]|uniref:Kinetochore NDC80 n=1 Tax=Micractinium conductrix TaxID=554055 RepID=A0A2P6VLD0_9CHLO|nr:Kinetochore NDC80 [Micractinium conductrix]|eukprot:PSC74916.1 Kinetochore NDC80 [Micractinium conductrix]
MDRRKTLAGLSPAQLNARASLAPSRGGGGKGVACGAGGRVPIEKALSRMSLAGPLARRSSAYTTKVAGVRSDPRPVSDKGFQAACVRTVIAYLAGHGFEYAITPKVLASPTTKDFANVMTFLFRQLDPGAPKAFKLEEEASPPGRPCGAAALGRGGAAYCCRSRAAAPHHAAGGRARVPQLYKRLKYPFQISKSNLTAVGSPHTWPSLLAALTWMVELLSYQERAEAARQDVSDERSRTEAEFFLYVSQVYRFFMTGDDGKCEEEDARQAEEFEARAGGVRAETERLCASNEALRVEIEQLRGQPSPLLAARQAREETLADKEKFLKLLDNLQTHNASLQRKLVERQADVTAQQAELAGVEAENKALRARVAAQTVHPADVQRMNSEKSKQESALRSTQAQRAQLDARVAQQERGTEERLDVVEAALQGYHSMADRLALIPATAKRAEGVAFEVRLDRGAASVSEMINVDLKGIVKPALQRLRDGYAAKARALTDQLLSLQEQADSVRELLAEREEENRNAEAQVHKLDGQYRAAKEALDQSIAAANAHVDQLSAEVAHLRNANGASVAASEERLRTLQAQYEDLLGRCELDNATLHRDLSAALEKILNHKLHLQSELKSVCSRTTAISAQLQQEASKRFFRAQGEAWRRPTSDFVFTAAWMRPKVAADMEFQLVAERERRNEAERRVSRAAENNAALAQNNLRLQQQLSRLRGEADVLEHELGCTRAAAAARERVAAAVLAKARAALQRADREARQLQEQLTGQQGIIQYLERKVKVLLQRLAGSGSSTQDLAACAADGEGCCGPGAGELGNSGGSARSTGGPAGVGLAGALRSPVPAAQHPLLQRAADSSAQEGDDGNSVSDCSTGSISLEVVEPLVSLDELATPEAPAAAAAAPAEQQEGRTPAAVVGAEPAAAEATPVRAAQPQQQQREASAQPPATAPRSSLRARPSISYAQPSLRAKLRKGDPFTFGEAEGGSGGAGAGSQARARTKPRPQYPAAQPGGGEATLQPVVD